jgi:choice-of-anchor A domain-containing protein
MKSVSSIIFAGAVWIGVMPLQAANIMMDLMDRFNVITGAGHYHAGNETEGSALVLGTYSASDRSRYGFNDGQVANDSEYTLWLNNGVSNGSPTTLLTGSLISRVPVNTSQFTLNGNAPGTPGITTGETQWNSAFAGLSVASANQLTSLLGLASQQWSQLSANSVGSLPGNGSYTFTATPATIDGHRVAIFNVSGDTLFAPNGGFDRLDLGLNGADTVLINVSGTNLNIAKNFAGDFTNNEKKVLFNFYQATTLTVDSNFRAGIFAPLANVTQLGKNFDGTVVAASLNQSAEIHHENFDGYLPFTIPEPSTALLAVAGLGFALRRRR